MRNYSVVLSRRVVLIGYPQRGARVLRLVELLMGIEYRSSRLLHSGGHLSSSEFRLRYQRLERWRSCLYRALCREALKCGRARA